MNDNKKPVDVKARDLRSKIFDMVFDYFCDQVEGELEQISEIGEEAFMDEMYNNILIGEKNLARLVRREWRGADGPGYLRDERGPSPYEWLQYDYVEEIAKCLIRGAELKAQREERGLQGEVEYLQKIAKEDIERAVKQWVGRQPIVEVLHRRVDQHEKVKMFWDIALYYSLGMIESIQGAKLLLLSNL